EKSEKSPAFQFYPADYLADAKVQLLTLEAEGMYMRSLCYAWREGHIPADCDQLARLIGKGATAQSVRQILHLFEPHPEDPTKLIHPRLEKEREKQLKRSRKASESASLRWHGNAMQTQCKRNAKSNANAKQKAKRSECSS